jgi:hypothetical protein
MNLLCPNCQKMLSVPDQYAGQMMKCPLCGTNFTVPALPAGASSAPPVPAFGDPPAGDGGPAPEPEIYGVKKDPVPAFITTAASNPPATPSVPTPAFSTGGSIPVPPTPSPAPTPSPSSPSLAPSPAASSTAAPSWNFSSTGSGSTEPSESVGFVLDPKILQYVPAASLVLIFFLHFFPWVGVYVGGYEITSQGAWGTAVGATSRIQPDLADFFTFTTDREAREKKDWDEKTASGNDPQFSLLTFFYLFPLFFIGLALSVGVVALPFIQVPLPPQVQQILPWRWAIVAGINALLLLFVVLQYLLPFSLESRMVSFANSDPTLKADDRDKSLVAVKKQVERGKVINQVQRTTWFNLVVLLHLIAAVTAGLVYWIEKRGPGKPLPRVEVRY